MRLYTAPLEGITGHVFRTALNECFGPADKYFIPFIKPNQRGHFSSREKEDILPEHNRGMYAVPQILTNSVDDFVRTAEKLQSYGYREINLNLGCPSGTVVSKGRGAGFLAFPRQLDQCLYEIFSGLDMKISVKTRLGKEDPEEFEELLDIYNRYHMEELIIHPRVRKDMYRNMPRLDMFAKALERSLNPVCYNGDIFRKEDEERIRERFPGLGAVMLGRGIIAYPGLLEEHDEKLSSERLREFHDRLYQANRQAYLAEAGQKVVLFKMKEIWCYLEWAFEDSRREAKRVKKAQTLGDYEAAVSAVFSTCRLIPGGGYRGTP